MEYPFFALAKQPRYEPIIYDDGERRFEVRPSARGIATIWDKDYLIYILSLIVDNIQRGRPVERTVRFTISDMLRFTGRATRATKGGTLYKQVRESMFRLRNTAIDTTIRSANLCVVRTFETVGAFF